MTKPLTRSWEIVSRYPHGSAAGFHDRGVSERIGSRHRFLPRSEPHFENKGLPLEQEGSLAKKGQRVDTWAGPRASNKALVKTLFHL